MKIDYLFETKKEKYRVKNDHDNPDEVEIGIKEASVELDLNLGFGDILNVPVGTTYADTAWMMLNDIRGVEIKEEEYKKTIDDEYVQNELNKSFTVKDDILCFGDDSEGLALKFIYREDRQKSWYVGISNNSYRFDSPELWDAEVYAYYKEIQTEDGTRVNVSVPGTPFKLYINPCRVSSDSIEDIGQYTIRYPSHLPFIQDNYKKYLKGTNNIIYILSENGTPITGEPPKIKNIQIKMKKNTSGAAYIKAIQFEGGKKIKPSKPIKITIDDYYVGDNNAGAVIKTNKLKINKKRQVKGLLVDFSDITVNGEPASFSKKPKKIKPKYTEIDAYFKLQFSGPFAGTVSPNSINGLDKAVEELMK